VTNNPSDPRWRYPWQRRPGHEVDDSEVVWIELGPGQWLKCRDPMANLPPMRDPIDDPSSGYGEPNG